MRSESTSYAFYTQNAFIADAAAPSFTPFTYFPSDVPSSTSEANFNQTINEARSESGAQVARQVRFRPFTGFAAYKSSLALAFALLSRPQLHSHYTLST